MTYIQKVGSVLKKPKILVEWLLRIPFPGYLISDKLAVSIFYRLRFGKKINLKKPTTFNEKLLWLTLYDRRPQYTKMADKYEAKEYVKEKLEKAELPTDCVIPTYGIYNSFDEIDFNDLPNSFVIKTTHDSGSVVVCSDKNKLDIGETRKIMEKSLKRNYFWYTREWPYKNIKPRIIIEKKLEGSNGILLEYKVFCFNGKAAYVMCIERGKNGKLKFCDMNWKLIPAKQGKEIGRNLCGETNYISERPNTWEK